MKSYSQNQEDIFISNYFGDHKGTLLEIGANDGITLSNSRLLIEQGWKADLIEPGYGACYKLTYTYLNDAPRVRVWDYGVGEKNEWVNFWDSDAHVPNGTDSGLVSTANFEETKRWPNVKFEKRQAMLQTFKKHCDNAKNYKYDFISIDAEGFDWLILQQIDLTAVECRCLCVEWNSDATLRTLFTDYCKPHGLTLARVNRENLIFTIDNYPDFNTNDERTAW